MRNNKLWLAAFGLATVLISAILFLRHNTKVVEQKYDTRQKQFEAQTRAEQLKEVQNLKKIIEQKDKELQSKAAEKARIAAETAQKASLAQKATSAIVPTANASQVPQSASDNHSLVTKWANHYGVDPAWMHRVVKCESGYRSNAVNGSYWAGGSTPTGISQFLASTYIANARRIGLPAVDERLNPDRSLQVMAWMFSIGQWTQWECR